MTIDEILRPTDVELRLRATDKAAAVEEVLAQVRGDERVKNWEKLRAAIVERDAPAITQGDVAVCIAHGRTDAVTALVVAVGISAEGVLCPETQSPVRLVFIAGVPSTMNSEYLRIVGAIARVCRNEGQMSTLLEARSGEAFVEALAAATERL